MKTLFIIVLIAGALYGVTRAFSVVPGELLHRGLAAVGLGSEVPLYEKTKEKGVHALGEVTSEVSENIERLTESKEEQLLEELEENINELDAASPDDAPEEVVRLIEETKTITQELKRGSEDEGILDRVGAIFSSSKNEIECIPTGSES